MKLKFFVTLLIALLVSSIVGGMLSSATGINPFVLSGFLIASSFVALPGGILASGVYVEVWTAELISKFRETADWLTRISNRSDLVNNNVIHMVDVGADPDVLINNTTYPIAVVTREDGDISISLDKYDTENTAVSDDELHAVSYDKMAVTIDLHKNALEEKTADKALHALAPSINSSVTPVLLTTGASNGETYARKRMIMADLRRMKKKLDDLKVPKKGRIAVLCNDHIADLLEVNETFANQYQNVAEGKLLKLAGFEIYEHTTCPIYSAVSGTLTKKAFGSVEAASTDQNASLFFYPQRAFRATGELKMFYSEASTDPENRRNVVGFKLYDIVLPKKWTGFGAVVSAIV